MAATADEEHGFLADTSLNVLERNFFLDNDYRTGHAGQSYRQEWAQGFIANLQSGFTQGTVGFGVDAHAFYGLKLDSGKGRAGTGCCRWAMTGELPTIIPMRAARSN